MQDIQQIVDIRMLAEALDGTQAFTQDEDLAGLQEVCRLLQAAIDAERKHTTEASRLFLGDVMVGVRGQAWQH